MGYKSVAVAPYAKYIAKKIKKDAQNAVQDQEQWRHKLVKKAAKTSFGLDHDIGWVKYADEFTKQVPIRDYEALKPYVDRMVSGEKNVLWPGVPAYYAKTSGTTSGSKYIPITKDSAPNHVNTARNALFAYVAETSDASVFDGKLMFLSGSPSLDETNGVLTGRLSGIVNHHVPKWVKGSQLPSYRVNCIEDWEEKVERVVDETLGQDMRLISGIPPWVLMYYERIQARTGKQIKDVFPNFSVFVHGGVNYAPYKDKLNSVIGKTIPAIETYPASEGFIAFQNSQESAGLLLNTNSGIYFEFIPADEFFKDNPTRISIADVKVGVNYVIILNTNAGLWGYNIGDTVKFVSVDPFKLVVTGRIKHYISAFGEHVIGEEVEYALMQTAQEVGVDVLEFTVAPQVNPTDTALPYHEWFIDFGKAQEDLAAFAMKVDEKLQLKNSYYKDLIVGGMLQTLIIRPLRSGAFRDYMKSLGKLGGQNKVPRLSNDRKIAEALRDFVLQ